MVSPTENCDDGSDNGIGCLIGCSSGYESTWVCTGGDIFTATDC